MFKLFAKSKTENDSADRITVGPSNIRGATGLSRAALTRMVARDGLFGRDSDFDADEHRVILAQLGTASFPQSAAANDRATYNPAGAERLQALQTFVACAISGKGSVSHTEWHRASEAGLSLAQRSEVLAVVGLLEETSGLHQPITRDEVRVAAVAVEPVEALSRAA